MQPFNIFGKKKSAQNRGTTKSENERLKHGKITIYPTPEQVKKLYDLMEAFKQRTGIQINQQDLIRRLIETADLKNILP